MLNIVLLFLSFGCMIAASNANDGIENFDNSKFEVVTTIEFASPNTTTSANDTGNSWQGYVGAVSAILFFGSTYVPLKKFNSGDGVFYQWVFCSAIWFCGVIINWIQNFPQFYPLAMLGGVLFTTGNMCVVPIVKTIGMALGILIWGFTNLLAGWITGRFGLFGLNPEVPTNTTLNYISIALALISTICWVFIKPQVSNADLGLSSEEDEEHRPLVREINVLSEQGDSTPDYAQILSHNKNSIQDNSWTSKLSTNSKRLIGVLLSLVSGVFYGSSFTPVLYIKDNYKGASQTDLDYVFAHFTGIFASSTIYFVVYCIVMKNKPKVYPSIILPGFLSGIMWAIADASWFVANEYLSEAVSFPIVTTGPGIIASLWGVIVFKEIKGRSNFIIMAIAYAFTIGAAVLAALSKK